MKKLRITIQQKLNEIDYISHLNEHNLENLDTIFKSIFPNYKVLYDEYGSDVVDKVFVEEFEKWDNSNYLTFCK